MIEGRVKEQHVDWFVTADGEGRLVSHETWVRVTVPGSVFGVSYRRPARVVSGDGAMSSAIVDHVMIARVGVLALGLGLAIWRLMR